MNGIKIAENSNNPHSVKGDKGNEY